MDCIILYYMSFSLLIWKHIIQPKSSIKLNKLFSKTSPFLAMPDGSLL